MSGKVNIRELEKFRDNLEQSLGASQIDEFIESCAKELTARLLAKVIRITPVGQKPKLEGAKFAKFEGASGKKKSFLTAEGARLEQYWNGYIGGTLRRGWTSKTHEEAKSGKGTPTLEQQKSFVETLKVHHYGDRYVIEVVNPVKYAPYVEYGHRQKPGRFVPALGKRLKSGWVEGKHMLSISADEIRADAPRVLENKLKKKLKEVFK